MLYYKLKKPIFRFIKVFIPLLFIPILCKCQNKLTFKKNTITDTIRTNIFNVPIDSSQLLYHKDFFYNPNKTKVRVDLIEIPFLSKIRFLSAEPILYNRKQNKFKLTAIIYYSLPTKGVNARSISIKNSIFGKPKVTSKIIYTELSNQAIDAYGYVIDTRKFRLSKSEYDKILKSIYQNSLFDVEGVDNNYSCVDGASTTIEISNSKRYNVIHTHCEPVSKEIEKFEIEIAKIGFDHFNEIQNAIMKK